MIYLVMHAVLPRSWVNTRLGKCRKRLCWLLRWSAGRMCYTWPSRRNGHLTLCIKQPESLLTTWKTARFSGFTATCCFLESEKISERTRGCTLLSTRLWRSLSTSLVLSIKASSSRFVRYVSSLPPLEQIIVIKKCCTSLTLCSFWICSLVHAVSEKLWL